MMGNLYAFALSGASEDVLIDGCPQGGYYESDEMAKEGARLVSQQLMDLGRKLQVIEVWRDECTDPNGEYESATQVPLGTVSFHRGKRGQVPGGQSGAMKPGTLIRHARAENR